MSCFPLFVCFFFQAEDGIRVRDVTGVQTCALPICPELLAKAAEFPLPEYQEDDFDACAREKRPFGYGVNEAFRSSTLVNLAALSVRLGRKLNFKSDASGFIGDDQANHLHTPALRGNWSL